MDTPSTRRDPPCRKLLSGIDLAHATSLRSMVDSQAILAPIMAIQLSLAIQGRNDPVRNNGGSGLRILGLATEKPR